MPQKRMTGLIGGLMSVMLLGCMSVAEPAQTSVEITPSATEAVAAFSQVESTPPTNSPTGDELLEIPVSPILPNQEAPDMAAKEYDPALEKLVEQAKADLAKRLSVSVEEVIVLETRAVIWPDSSLGCPQEGIAYTQVPQDGVLIRLGVGGHMYFYHSGEAEEPFLCEGTSLLVPEITPKHDEMVPPPDAEID